MTPEEKQAELKRYRDILLATLDYLVEQRRSAPIQYDGGHDPALQHLEGLKTQTEEMYQKGRLSRLKHWFRDLTEGLREARNLAFIRYIKEQTGQDIDLFGSYQKRIDKIIAQKKIKTEVQYRDVLAMVDHLSQQTPLDQSTIDTLNNLLVDFDDRVRGTKTPKSKRRASRTDNYFTNQVSSHRSPDGKRTLLLTEYGTDESNCGTQVFLQFERSGAGVYATNGINLGIQAYWKDNHTIVIETKKEYFATQRWQQVQSLQDIVKVEYMET